MGRSYRGQGQFVILEPLLIAQPQLMREGDDLEGVVPNRKKRSRGAEADKRGQI